MNLVQHPENTECVEALKSHKMFVRMANFANYSLKMWGPCVHGRFRHTLNEVLRRDHSLKHNFDKTVFTAMTLNLGPQTVTYCHTDNLNVPWGWCAITVIGDYDPKTGGHLILWDLGITVEFPPGSTILIPLAILLHSNDALHEGEHRYSLTQYTAGALFRWEECGFQLEASFKGAYTCSAAQRWEEGANMLCDWEEVRGAIEARLVKWGPQL
ncbi:hypothetical protein C8T65DRAFT_571344 [Cerioporus squamosus]|nr:hypothetical protein C8T65DRAFT_571344 [Cerioporus squamosus]